MAIETLIYILYMSFYYWFIYTVCTFVCIIDLPIFFCIPVLYIWMQIQIP